MLHLRRKVHIRNENTCYDDVVIRLFVSDIDGTLLNERSELEKETIDAIERFQKKGGIFMIATGRNRWEVDQVTSLVDDVVINCVNGAVLCLENGDVILSESLNKDVVFNIAQYCMKNDILVEFHGFDYTYTMYDEKTFRERSDRHFLKSLDQETADEYYRLIFGRGTMVYDLSLEEILTHEIAKIEVLYIDDEKKDLFRKECSDVLSLCNASCDSFMSNIEITSDKADKGLAIRHYCEFMGIDEDEVLVIGDSGNDIPMLEKFKNSYAVANADEETKKAANYTALSNHELAVARLIDEILKDH